MTTATPSIRILSRRRTLLLAGTLVFGVACGEPVSSGDSGPPDTDLGADTRTTDTFPSTDTSVTPGDTGGDFAEDAGADTANQDPPPQQLMLVNADAQLRESGAVPVLEMTSANGSVIGALMADFDGDGTLDIAAWTDADKVMVNRYVGGGNDIYSFEGQPAIDLPFEGQMGTGDFDGDGRTDIIVMDRSTGEFAIALNSRDGLLRDFHTFTEHAEKIQLPGLTSFDDPALGFDDPTWVVGDLDGNGTDDLAMVAGERLLTIVLSTGPDSEWTKPISFVSLHQSLNSFDDPALGFGDPENELGEPVAPMPSAITTYQHDDDPGLELVVGFRSNGGVQRSDVVLFDDPALGFDDPALGFDDPALGFGVPVVETLARKRLSGAVQEIVATDVDGSEAQDLALLTHLGDQEPVTGVALWTRNGFDDPALGFEPAVFAPGEAGTDNNYRWVEGTLNSLEASTFVSALNENPFQVRAASQLLLRSNQSMVMVNLSDEGFFAGASSMTVPPDALQMQMADIDRDGFAEFIRSDGALELVPQDTAAYDTTNQCVDRPLCPTGAVGVCATGHMTCGADSTCEILDPTDADAYQPGGESGEGLCDGLDNDCDGLIDEQLVAEMLSLGFDETVNVGRVSLQRDRNGALLVAETRGASYGRALEVFRLDESGTVPEAKTFVRITGLDPVGEWRAASDGTDLAVLIPTPTGSALQVIDQTGAMVEQVATDALPSKATLVRAFGKWFVVYSEGGSVYAQSPEMATPDLLLEFAAPIGPIQAAGAQDGLFVAAVTVRTGEQRLYLLDVAEGAENNLALADLRQVDLGAAALVADLALSGDARNSCLTLLERAETTAVARLTALQIKFGGTLTLEGRHFLSKHDVVPGSVSVAHLGSLECAVSWVEALPTQGDLGLARHARISLDEVRAQDLGDFPSTVRPSMLARSNDLLVTAGRPQTSTMSLPLPLNAFCAP